MLAAILATSVAVPAQGFWGATSVAGGNGAGAAASVGAGAVPSVTVSGSTVTVSWAASTLSDGGPVAGYVVRRYDASTLAAQTVGAGCAGTVATLTCAETGVPEGSWRYSVTPVIGTSWRGPESALSTARWVDLVAPASSVAVNQVSGSIYRTGATVYYRGSLAGSLTLTNTVTDSRSGPAGSTSSLGGTSTGWTHTASTVSTPSGGPYVSNAFSWAVGSSSSPTVTATGLDNAGNTAPVSFTMVDDSTGPATGSINYTGGLLTSPTTTVTFTAGADSGSGVATARLQRASATYSNGACGTYSSFADIGGSAPTSPYTDTTLANSTCYMYRTFVTDQLGNSTATTSATVARVDYAGTVAATPGLVSYWRLGESRAQTTVTTESFTGPAGSTLQTHVGEAGATWGRHPSSYGDAVLTPDGRIRKGGTATLGQGYYSSGAPTSANYTVAADVTLLTSELHDSAGVVGRMVTSSASGYQAGWDVDRNVWFLSALSNGSRPKIWTDARRPLLPGTTARIQLVMVGTSLKVLVDGQLLISVVDGTFPNAGVPGIVLGAGLDGLASTTSDTTGLALDNYSASGGFMTLLDSKGSNIGDYENGAARSALNPLGADTDGSTSMDGVDDFAQVDVPAGLPTGAAARSVELWLRTSSTARQVLFDYGSRAADGQKFGLWLNAGGTSLTAYGGGAAQDRTFTVASSLANGAWHHLVVTYDGTTLTVYVDGTALPTQSASRNTVLDSYGFVLGAVLNPGEAGVTGGYLSGLVDDVSLYNVVLTPAQVTSHRAVALAR